MKYWSLSTITIPDPLSVGLIIMLSSLRISCNAFSSWFVKFIVFLCFIPFIMSSLTTSIYVSNQIFLPGFGIKVTFLSAMVYGSSPIIFLVIFVMFIKILFQSHSSLLFWQICNHLTNINRFSRWHKWESLRHSFTWSSVITFCDKVTECTVLIDSFVTFLKRKLLIKTYAIPNYVYRYESGYPLKGPCYTTFGHIYLSITGKKK